MSRPKKDPVWRALDAYFSLTTDGKLVFDRDRNLIEKRLGSVRPEATVPRRAPGHLKKLADRQPDGTLAAAGKEV